MNVLYKKESVLRHNLKRFYKTFSEIAWFNLIGILERVTQKNIKKFNSVQEPIKQIKSVVCSTPTDLVKGSGSIRLSALTYFMI